MDKEMMYKKLMNMKPYVADEILKDEIILNGNESTFDIKSKLKDEIIDVIMKINFNRYPEAASDSLCRVYGDYLGILPENIMAGNGSDDLIQIITSSLLSPGDITLGMSPDFSMYKFYSSFQECDFKTINYIEKENNFEFPMEEFKKNLKDAKLVILSNPNNPTGNVIPKKSILEILCSTDAIVVIDEAYIDFGGESLIDEINNYPNLIILRTCSKALAMAGLRLGFAIGNSNLINSLMRAKPPYNVNIVTEKLGELVLKNSDIIVENLEFIKDEREYVMNILRQMRSSDFIVYETSTNFVYIKTSKANYIYEELRKNGVLIRRFKDNHIRITFGTRSENDAMIMNLKNVMGV